MLSDYANMSKQEIERFKKVVSQLYTKDSAGNIKVNDGVTKHQLLQALRVAKKMEQAFEEMNFDLVDLNKEIDKHCSQVEKTRKLMNQYKEFLPNWMLKAWGV